MNVHPVTSLVGQSPAEVVVGGRASGGGAVEHDDTIVFGLALVVAGEGGIAEETLAGSGLEADTVEIVA